MLYAEKANRRVRIADEKKDEYVGMGYTIKNLDGSMVKAPDDPKKENADLKKENAELEERLKAATGRVDELSKNVSDLTAEKNELEGKLAEASKYAEDADKKIEKLEAELKAVTAGTGKQEGSDKAPDAGKKGSKDKQTEK